MSSERLPNLARAQKFQSKPEPALPPIAAEADDLTAIKKTVEDAATVGGGLWISYLFSLFYIAIAAGAVTHVDLLLERPISLPFLSIKLPLLAFFVLAPILFLISHAYTMAHFVMLADKSKRFHRLLHVQIRGSEGKPASKRKAFFIRTGLRRQLPSNIFVQLLAGPDRLRAGPFGILLKSIAWMTLAILPVALLLLLQLQFLPYHNTIITWLHRVMIIVDLALIWWLWRKILDGQGKVAAVDHESRQTARLAGGAASVSVIAFSIYIATFPGEWSLWPYSWAAAAEPVEATRFVFGWVELSNNHLIGAWPVNALRLREFDIDQLDAKERVISAHNRNFEGADFSFANLGKADFRYSQFDHATLLQASLAGAKLDGAELLATALTSTNLAGASFVGAVLKSANLSYARMQGATFEGAHLQGAILDYANASGASFKDARLLGASIQGARLQGGILNGAFLRGASLKSANLQAALLEGAQLQGAELGGASLEAASFSRADLEGGRFSGATFRATALPIERAPLWRATLDASEVKALLPATPPSSYHPKTGYPALQKMIEDEILVGPWRDKALERIRDLSCDASKAANLATCDAPLVWPPKADAAFETLQRAKVDADSYRKELAEELTLLLCSGSDDAVHVMRGVFFHRSESDVVRQRFGGPDLQRLLDRLFRGNDCPIRLTEDDRAKLTELKRDMIVKDKNAAGGEEKAGAPAAGLPSRGDFRPAFRAPLSNSPALQYRGRERS